MKHFFSQLFVNNRLYLSLAALTVLWVFGQFFTTAFLIAQVVVPVLIFLLLLDGYLLFFTRGEIFSFRETPKRFSNGDLNPVRLYLENRYRFPVNLEIIDELPVQFQSRDFVMSANLPPGGHTYLRYEVKPTRRGEYHFGNINVYTSSPLALWQRRFQIDARTMTPVYPSFIQMRKYELLAISNRLTEVGIKKIRRVGHTMEFEHIREYVIGDDVRTINWKATARRHEFMVNHYQDERAQPVYSLINMGRVMKMPFNGMSLLDYAINASLVISNIAILKQDRAGVITFSHEIGEILPARRQSLQMAKIIELLYRQETDFLETDYEALFATLMRRISRRSLFLMFTNFETLSSLRRQLHFLRKISQKHLLVIIFFENTELSKVIQQPARTAREISVKAVAQQFALEKKQIVKELHRHGIHAVLTPPEKLTVNTINTYLQLKSRGLI